MRVRAIIGRLYPRMVRTVVKNLIAALLFVEALNSAAWLTGLVQTVGSRDAVQLGLMALRGGVTALQLAGALQLFDGRARGSTLASWALAASAVLVTFETGWRLAPSNADLTYRWWFVGAYWVYAAASTWWLRRSSQ